MCPYARAKRFSKRNGRRSTDTIIENSRLGMLDQWGVLYDVLT